MARRAQPDGVDREDWFTVTVIPVFGRWGVAVCRDEAPRRAEPLEVVGRVRTEAAARGRALLLVQDTLNGRLARDAGVLVRDS